MARRVIEIRFEGTVAVVDRSDADVIAPLLTYRAYCSSTSNGMVRTNSLPQTLGRVAEDTFRFPAKLYRYVQVATEDRGITFRPVQLPFGRCMPDTAALESLPEPAKSIFSSNGTHFGGLIQSGSGTDPWTLIPHMLRLYPQYRTVLPVRNREEEQRWVRHLRGKGLSQRVCSTRDLNLKWGSEPKVYVGSFHRLDSCGSHDFNIVIVPDLQTIADHERWDLNVRERDCWDFHVLRLPIVPAFGFIARHHRPSRGEWLRLGAAFGQAILIPSRDPVRVLVRGVPFRHSATSKCREYWKSNPASHKREMIWQCAGRNRLVADLAAEYRSTNSIRRIVLLVENPCHARELMPLLPEWEFRDVNSSLIIEEKDRYLIVTETWAEKATDLGIEVLIEVRGAKAIGLKGYPPRSTSPDHTVLLVDVDDTGDRLLEANAKERHDRYGKRGWQLSSSGEGPGIASLV